MSASYELFIMHSCPYCRKVLLYMDKNGIELPGSVTMLARSLVTLEGVVHALLPDASIVEIIHAHLVAHRTLDGMIKSEGKRLAQEGVAATHGLLGAASEAGLAMRMLTRGQLRVNLDLAGTEDPLEDVGDGRFLPPAHIPRFGIVAARAVVPATGGVDGRAETGAIHRRVFQYVQERECHRLNRGLRGLSTRRAWLCSSGRSSRRGSP